MNSRFEKYVEQIEQDLEEAIPKYEGPFEILYESMRYSYLGGGKRIRPLLMRLAYEAVGGSGNISTFQAAIEMVHTYSLIHDDLPAMDNDDLRRGKPTNHKQFDEATAILAGDALLNQAYESTLEEAMLEEDMDKVRAAYILAHASGMHGMVAGQVLDMESEGKIIDVEILDMIHVHKTGALISAAVKMGAVLGSGSKIEIAALETYGKYLGKVFQIVDDILDVTSSTDTLGKPINSDDKNEKTTYITLYGKDKCYEIAEELTSKAVNCLKQVEGDTTLLAELALELVHRTK